METINVVLDILIFCYGLYCLYSCYRMKTKGEVDGNVLLSNNTDMKKCRDKDAYLREMLPKLLLLGVVTVIYGTMGLVDTFVVKLGQAYTIGAVVFLVTLAWFAIMAHKAQEKYFPQNMKRGRR